MPKVSDKGVKCGKCEKVLSSRYKLKDHNLVKHNWCIDTDAPATPEMLEKFKRKAATATTAKKQRVSTQPTGEGKEATQSESDILDISSSDELEDVEPSRAQPPAPTLQEPGSSQKKMAIIDWSLKPLSVSDPRQPCEKKKLEMAKPSAPIKEFLLSRGITQKPGGSKDTPSAERISSLIPSFSGDLSVHPLYDCTKNWPERNKLPSIRDIIGYRNTVPLDTPPVEVAKLSALKFG